MSGEENKGKGVTSSASLTIRPTSGKTSSVGAPPAKRTISELSDTSAEELSIIHQQLDDLNSDVKETKDKVMSLMSKDETEEFIGKAIDRAMSKMLVTLNKTVDKKVKEKTTDLEERIKSLEFENQNLKDRLTKTEKDLKTCEENTKACEKLAISSAQKSNYNEQYSRKNNIKIMNIEEAENETETKLIHTVCTELLAKGNVDLNPDDIVAIHRIPGKTGLPKPVLMKLRNTSAKTAIMKQRTAMKMAGRRLVDDVTKLNTGLIGRLLKHAKIDSAWYYNGAVYGKTSDGKRHKFDVYCNIDSVIKPRVAAAAGGEDDEVSEMEVTVLEP